MVSRLLVLATAAVAATLVLLGTAITLLYQARQDALARAEQVAGNLVLSLERDILRNVELYDLSIRSTIAALGLTGLDHLAPETRHAALFDSLPRASDFGPIVVTDAVGQVIDESGAIEPRVRAFTDRDWFNYLQSHPEPGLHLSLALHTTLTGRAGLVLSRRINRNDGSFGGTVAGVIYLDYFTSLFDGLQLDEGNVVELSIGDRRIVSRRPFAVADAGQTIRDADVLQQIAAQPTGTFQHVSSSDQRWRLFVFRHVGNFPLVMQVGLSADAVWGEWSRKAVVIGLLLVGFAVITAILLAATRRELGRRLQVEGRLRESEASFRLLAEHASDMVTRVGADGVRHYVSPGCSRVFGVPPTKLIRTGLHQFIHRDDRELVLSFQKRLLNGAVETDTLTFRGLHPGRGEVWVESTAAVVANFETTAPDGYVAVLRDVTDRKRSEASMAEANRWLILSEQVGNLGHWRYKPATGRLYWSAQVYRIYGLDPDGPPPTLQLAVDACAPPDRQRLLDAITGAINEQAGFSIDVRVDRPTGEPRHVQIRAVVETGSDHGLTALFGVVVDNTDQVNAAAAVQVLAERERRAIETSNERLERLAANLAVARDEAQRANRAKSRFLAGMSHELRTPLNGILGYAQLLARDGELGPSQTARVKAMLTAGNHLLDMVNQVLSLAEVELGQTELKQTGVDPVELASSCLDLVRPAAETKGLTLAMTSEERVPRHLVTDATRLRQVLLNILGNAVKFTEAGKVAIHLRLAGDRLRFDVVDTGPGICSTKRHRLFQDFDRLDSKDAVEGAGLGLALSAQLASALGGRLSHDDIPQGGSCFTLELPVAIGVPAPAQPTTPAAASTTPETPVAAETFSILLVDDVAMNRDIAGSFLRSAGHDVAFASSGAEAVEAATSTVFDLILMDVRMPGMDGLRATELIRALPGKHALVPIVALTAQAFADQIEDCRRAGMDDHLPKPFTPDALFATVAKAVARRQQTPQAHQPTLDPVAARPDLEVGADLRVFDPDVFDRTASYLDRDALATYVEAIATRSRDLCRALRRHGALSAADPALAAAAHTLAGSSAMLGFERLSELSRKLERELEQGSPDVQGVAAAVIACAELSLIRMADLSPGQQLIAEPTG